MTTESTTITNQPKFNVCGHVFDRRFLVFANLFLLLKEKTPLLPFWYSIDHRIVIALIFQQHCIVSETLFIRYALLPGPDAGCILMTDICKMMLSECTMYTYWAIHNLKVLIFTA